MSRCILRQNKIRGIGFKVDPEFFKLTENIRSKLKIKGIKRVSQQKISQMIARRLRGNRII